MLKPTKCINTNISKTFDGSDNTNREDIREKLIKFPKPTGDLYSVYRIFKVIRKIIEEEVESTFTFDSNIVRISRIEDQHNTICVTHKPSGYGWGYYYSSDVENVEVLLKNEHTVIIAPAQYVWVVIDGDDNKACDPKYVRSFGSKGAAERWNKEKKGTIYKFRHYTTS